MVQPMLVGSRAYRRYFEDQFEDGKVYISKYVQMEIKRSFIEPFIDFYHFADSPVYETVGEAHSSYRNSFKPSKKAAAMVLVGLLMDMRGLDTANPRDKPKVLRHIAFIIKRIERKLRKDFTNIGINTTRCERAKVSFISPHMAHYTLAEQMDRFAEKFNDVKACRNQCRIDDFILDKFKPEVDRLIEHAEKLDRPKSRENRGFVDVAKNLQKIISDGADVCSCKMCPKIGDAVIALEMLPNMRLEHTDHSFDNLCPVIGKAHKKHPAEQSFKKCLQLVFEFLGFLGELKRQNL